MVPILLRLAALVTLTEYCSGEFVQYQLSELWRKRERNDVQLYPTLSSAIYPSFVGFPYPTGSSQVHMTKEDVEKLAGRDGNTTITSICSYVYLRATFYVVNMEKDDGEKVEISLNLTMSDLEAKIEEMLLRSMKPAHICRGPDGLFQIVWKGSSKYLRHYIIQEGEISSIFREDAKHGRHGYYPTSIQVYRSENHTTALIVWEKGYGVKHRIQSGAFLTLMSEEMSTATMRPFNLAALPGKTARHATKYFVIWRSDEFSWAGRVIPRSSSSDPSPQNVTELDAAVEKEMRAFEIPSLSLCIYRKGKRMLSVAYGFSNLRTEQRATPNSTYRVASISKTITAMGIAELVNRGQLSLDSKVFGVKGILPLLAVDQGHPWLRYITVRHLLEHSSAGWGNQEKIEFNRTPQTKRLNGTALLEFYIRAYAPKFQPGRQHLYSNIAYVILGRVIEEVTLRPYEAFISDVVLQPNHIEARMGKTEAGENEVAYYSPDNANPYTYWSPSKLDAAAGWVMKAEEVARLFMLIESRKHTWYRLLTQPSDVKRSYGRGLQLGNDGSLYHIGSLAGSEGIGYTRGDLQVAILTNTRGREQGEHTAWMERLCRQFAEHIVVP